MEEPGYSVLSPDRQMAFPTGQVHSHQKALLQRTLRHSLRQPCGKGGQRESLQQIHEGWGKGQWPSGLRSLASPSCFGIQTTVSTPAGRALVSFSP